MTNYSNPLIQALDFDIIPGNPPLKLKRK